MTRDAAPSRRDWRGILLLAFAYFAVARTARLIAIPPGYATIVWPSAGIAFGALWTWGVELWPGVLLGSFAANAWNPGGAAAPAPLALAAWIAAGAALQAAAAAFLARRALQGRDPLAEEKDLFRFLAIGGPAACLIASTWALIGLRRLGAITPEESAYSWATWWIGDAIGVATAAPLILLWNGPGPNLERRGRRAVAATLTATMIGIAVVHLYAVRDEEQKVLDSASQRLTDVSMTLSVGLNGHLDAVQSAAGFFNSVPEATRAQFGRFAEGVRARHPGLQALEWRPRVRDAQRGAVEAAARRDGLKDFAFRETDGRTVRPRAPEYYPILYAEPARGNEKALGMDITQTSMIREAATRAIATGRPAASGPVQLIQDRESRNSVVVMVPAVAADGRVSGLVEGVYRVDEMIEALLAGADSKSLGIRILDETPPGPPRLLYARPGPGETAAPPLSISGDFGERRWRVELSPRAPAGRGRSALTWFVLLAALFFAYLIAWITLTLLGQTERVAALVESRTSELREQERRLLRAQKMESVGRLAGGIAHEFNNILMGASGLAQIVLQTVGPKHPSAPDLEGIVAAIKRAGNLVTQLLTYSRNKEAVVRPTDLNAVIGKVSKMLGVAVGAQARFDVDAGPSPAWIMADPGQVEQVLLNLAFNARDAIKGKGAVRVSTREILLERGLDTPFLSAKPGRYVALEVADDGPGIPSDVLPRILEPFFTTKPFGEGTGLGLSVVSGIVRQHGGALDIRTGDGRGTALTVYWPACDPPPPEKTPSPSEGAPRGAGKILIVDDEPLMQPLLERILTGYGYECVSVGGGAEALDVLARSPDIRGAVLDLVMPGMDGLETYDRMIRIRPDLKVLILSGYAPPQSEREVARRGLPFLTKPADPERLARALHAALTSPLA
ncbi:MAG: CHASE domain-containing protein [Elusimicrobiota bacterium]